jgi:hypothetical protein
MKFFYLSVAVLASDLCATWMPTNGGGKCVPGQSCCAQDASYPGNCTSPVTPLTSSFIAQEDYAFAFDGSYAVQFLIGTGNCPLSTACSTLTTEVTTFGVYTAQGANNITGNWTKLTYQPQTFEATITKTNKACFFTPGYDIGGGAVAGPCINLQTLFNDPDYGCPCNGSWSVAPYNGSGLSPASRTINKTACPAVNGSSSCPENYFFSTSARYGNYRVYNISNNTMRQLDITRPVFSQTAGWNDSIVYASFTANFTCPIAVTPTPQPVKSSAAVLSSSAVVAAAVLFVM